MLKHLFLFATVVLSAVFAVELRRDDKVFLEDLIKIKKKEKA